MTRTARYGGARSWWVGWLGPHRTGGTVLYHRGEFVMEHPKNAGKARVEDYYPPGWVGLSDAPYHTPDG